ncbi:MAG TPA: gas vesicle protein GvpG [Thermoanaerobaculia bacterium]|nr:gas vesicle protein GvpG [Thermoanaerobaculia bacterium]
MNAPLQGLFFVFREIADRAEEELNDDGPVRNELMDLYKCLEAGTVSEDDFSRRDAELVERLEVIERRKKRRHGHGTH